MKLARAAPLLAALLTGCLNFHEPETEARRGRLDLYLYHSGTAGGFVVEGVMRMARGPDGQVEALADSTVHVLGQSLEPVETDDTAAALAYRRQWSSVPDAGESSRIRIEGPPAGEDRSRVGLSLPFIRPSGPDSLVVEPGADVRLPISTGPPDAYRHVWTMSWRLTVSGTPEHDLKNHHTLEGTGAPPDTLDLQYELLQPESGGAVRVIGLRVELTSERREDTLPYDVTASATGELRWRVILE